MANVFPFRAWRYNPEKVPLGRAVTQPYDKITPDMQARYYAASPYNLVRIILGKRQASDDERNNVYTRAADYFQRWRAEGVLKQDAEPSLYVYAQRFAVPGSDRTLERRGFIGLGQIYDYDQGVVFRHEQTLAKPKADRLELLRATRAHFGQIFMLYSDPERRVERALAPTCAPTMEVRDEYGVEHRVWRVTDPQALAQAQQAMADKKLIIADGHHRYETALSYRNERRAQEHAAVPSPAVAHRGKETPAHTAPAATMQSAEAGYERVMMTFVNMDAEGLVILPTHRVVFGLPAFDQDLMLRSVWGYFEVEKAPSEPAAMLSRLTEAGQERIAIAAVTATDSFLLRARPNASDSLLQSFSSRQRQLDVVHLHKVLLEHVLGISEEDIRQQKHVAYYRDPGEAIGRVRQGANLAFLLNPVRMEQVRDIAFAGEVLPQKSTDFYPKLLSGLTTYALD